MGLSGRAVGAERARPLSNTDLAGDSLARLASLGGRRRADASIGAIDACWLMPVLVAHQGGVLGFGAHLGFGPHELWRPSSTISASTTSSSLAPLPLAGPAPA